MFPSRMGRVSKTILKGLFFQTEQKKLAFFGSLILGAELMWGIGEV